MSRKEIQLRDILQALHWILQNILHCFLESYAKRPQPALITLYPVYYRITPILKNFSTNLEPKVGLRRFHTVTGCPALQLRWREERSEAWKCLPPALCSTRSR